MATLEGGEQFFRLVVTYNCPKKNLFMSHLTRKSLVQERKRSRHKMNEVIPAISMNNLLI
jgi:hypothetical protein